MEDYSNYSSNSDKTRREPEKKDRIQKVVSGSVERSRPSFLRRALDSFIPEEVDNPAEYVMLDIILPVLKQSIYDLGNGVWNELFGYHDHAGRSGYREYDKISSKQAKPKTRRSNQERDLDYENIQYKSRREAEAVISALNERIYDVGYASIIDLYDAAGVETSNWSLDNYGWISELRTAHVVPVRGHYELRFPRHIPLDK